MMMDIIADTAEVAQIAFGSRTSANASLITPQSILTAQLKYLKAALGDSMYDAVVQGLYPCLVEQYLKLPLALFTKSIVIRSADYVVGGMGVVRSNNQNVSTLTTREYGAIVRYIRSDATMFLRNAIDYIRANPDKFPHYDPTKSHLREPSIAGGIIL